MFIKTIPKKNRNGELKYVHYRLCESYRLDNKVRHRTIIDLGSLEDIKENERKILADRIEQIIYGQLDIFSDIPVHIEKYAQNFAQKIIEKGLVDIQANIDRGNVIEEDYAEVNINSIENRKAREIGGEWILKQTLDKLGIEDLLLSSGFDKRWSDISLINWISKTINPLSELGTETWLRRNTGLCELFNIDCKKINRFHLYEAGRKLYEHKTLLENYFSIKTNQLFNLNDNIILYDLTNSYFEGRMLSSEKAKYYKSKEKRSDAKLIALALVTNIYGFIKYSRIYKGNMADCKTLETTIEDLDKTYQLSHRKPTVVMDAGLSTEDNLKMLRTKGYSYLCVSRSSIKEYITHQSVPLIIYDKKDQPIEIKKVEQNKNDDRYLYVKSEAKESKEVSIEEKLSKRFEEGLKSINSSLNKKKGIKTIEKVYERLGRLRAKYPRVSNRFVIKTEQEKGNVKKIIWEIKNNNNDVSENGVYFIRTNINDTEEKTMWNIYNTIREIESTFRCLKSELNIRPNYHQYDENIESHIHLGLLAYQLVSIIRHQLKASGIHDSWTTLITKMNTQKVITTSMLQKDGNKIHVRNCTVPEAELKEIYQVLKLKPVPFYKKRCSPPKNDSTQD